MALLLITYDLNNPGQNYEDLYNEIKSYKIWWHHLDSTWIIKTEKSVSQVRDHLGKYIDLNDELLIVKIDSWAGKGFKDRAYEWLHNNKG
ncbi:hypothetical protein [Chryseobacterium hispalense]|uniref:hypothetical protein n=1 Tax=Chryseobacterium hispalense TaxID=1453492 RepID=UPI00391C6850